MNEQEKTVRFEAYNRRTHTYGRIDKEGTFHTLWSGDRSEVDAVDAH